MPSADSPRSREMLPPRLLELIAKLHHEFEDERRELLTARDERQARYDRGELPTWVPEHPAHHEEWQVAPIPEDLQDRRVEITGPAHNAKMVIQMLNGTPEACADTAMLDLEDSMKPTWKNVIDAFYNIVAAAEGTLSYAQPAMPGQPTRLYIQRPRSDNAHMMIRVRGLHLNETHVTVDGEPVAASLFDLAICAFQTINHHVLAERTPKYYVPKCEHYLEARWWNRLFSRVESELELPPGCLRVTLLIETLPAAFQMEEILYETRSRACGLNGGRWDKIFSDIKTLRNHKDRVLADRATIDMTKPWMDNYAKLLIKVCHQHGAFAMGGMAAFTPGKTDELVKAQTEKVRKDKAREAEIGHDGCWVSHPYFIGIARSQFPRKNQLDRKLEDFPDHPDLVPRSTPPKTMNGLRTNVRVGIGYMNGWLQGIGCVALDNLMEDLATLEISRAQVWQWFHNRVELDDGTIVTRELVSRVFDEELARIIEESPELTGLEKEALVRAAETAREVFLMPELPNFLSDALSESDEPVTLRKTA